MMTSFVNPLTNSIPPVRSTSATTSRAAAAQLISTSLVQPALEAWQHSPLQPKEGPFARSTIEKRFAPLLNQELADRMTDGANFKLIDEVARRFERTQSL